MEEEVARIMRWDGKTVGRIMRSDGRKGGLLILFTRDRDEKVAMLFERFRILSDDVVETEIQFVEGERL